MFFYLEDIKIKLNYIALLLLEVVDFIFTKTLLIDFIWYNKNKYFEIKRFNIE